VEPTRLGRIRSRAGTVIRCTLAARRDTGSFRAQTVGSAKPAAIGSEGSKTRHALSRLATIEPIEARSSRSKTLSSRNKTEATEDGQP
jgi:hypothetical protein